MLSWAFTFSFYASPSWSLRAAARNSFRRISRSTVGLLNCPAPLLSAVWFNALMSDLINDDVSSARAGSFSSRLSLQSLGPRDLSRSRLLPLYLSRECLPLLYRLLRDDRDCFLEPDRLLLDLPLLCADPNLLALPPDRSLSSLDLTFLLLSLDLFLSLERFCDLSRALDLSRSLDLPLPLLSSVGTSRFDFSVLFWLVSLALTLLPPEDCARDSLLWCRLFRGGLFSLPLSDLLRPPSSRSFGIAFLRSSSWFFFLVFRGFATLVLPGFFFFTFRPVPFPFSCTSPCFYSSLNSPGSSGAPSSSVSADPRANLRVDRTNSILLVLIFPDSFLD